MGRKKIIIRNFFFM